MAAAPNYFDRYDNASSGETPSVELSSAPDQPHVTHPVEAKEGDPVPASGVPEGFYAVTEDGGKHTLRRNLSAGDIVWFLNNLPGMGAAEHAAAGLVNLGGKAVSGLAGLVSGGDADTVERTQQALHVTPPASTDPVLQGMQALQQGAESAIGAPVDKAVGNLPPGLRTSIEATEEAIPDVATLVGMRGAPSESAAVAPNVARTPQEVAQAAGYTGLRTKADLAAPGNQAITDTLISQDAGLVPGQTPSVAALENARQVGPGKIYQQVENDLPNKLTQDDKLRADLGNLPQQASQLPRSPDIQDLQEVMLKQPEMTKDELFANIREARQRAKADWKSDDPDKHARGDAYANLANAYEDFVGRQLEASGSDATLADWQQARVQMAKNYQAQGALRGQNFSSQVFAKTAERNPHLLTGNAAIVGHVANGLPSAGTIGMADLAPSAAGAVAGGALGHLGGAPEIGAGMGAVAGPLVRARLQQLLTRGRPDIAAGTQGSSALSYFFPQGKSLSSGWNRSPVTPQFGGYLPSPAMVNAGGGASTPSALEALGLTPDVQEAARWHPGSPSPWTEERAARAAQREEDAIPPPMPTVDFQGPQKWGDFAFDLRPQNQLGAQKEGLPFANVLSTAHPPAEDLKLAASQAPAGPSSAQLAFRSKAAADRLRKLAGDLTLEGPGGATGTPAERALRALQRRARGYAKGGSVRKKVPVRVIVEWPRDKDGAYLQPQKNSPELEKVMNHNRMRAANQFDLADTHGFGNAHTYDPLGNYECFTCNQYVEGKNDCMVIEDIVAGPDGDIQAGSSCRHYEELCAGDPETPLKRTTKAAALFGTAVNRKGFGCKRCGWRRDSLWVDSIGRDVWCGAMYFTTEPNVCCAVNSAKTLPDGTPIKKAH